MYTMRSPPACYNPHVSRKKSKTPIPSRKPKTRGPQTGPSPAQRATEILDAAIPELAQEAVKLAKRGKPTLLRVLRRILKDAQEDHTDPATALHRHALKFLHHIPRPKRG